MGSVQDLRFGLRYLRRNPGFSITAIAIVALGIGLSATLFAVVKGALLQPWPYHGYDRLVTVRGNYPEQGRTAFSLWSAREISDLRAQSDIFAQVIAGNARNVNLTYEGTPERVRAAVLTPNAFEMLGVPAFLGRPLQERDAIKGAAPVVVVSYDFWRTRLGGQANVIGETLRMDDGLFSIVGVMPPQFVFWDRSLWMPLILDPGDPRTERRYYVQAQLRPGITARDAESRLGLFTTRLGRDNPEVAEYAGLSITLTSLVDNVLRDLRPTLYGLLAGVGLVLFVAAANLANAMLAKGLAREGELALRRALGASRGRIARQLLIESSLISVAGAAVGALFASFLLPYVVSLVPYGYVPAEARIEMDWRVLMFAVAISIVSGVLIGLVPAERAARIEPGTLLQRSNLRTALGRTHAWSRVFITAQVTMAIVMLGLALAAFESVRAVVGRYPGFESGQIWTAVIALPAGSSSDSARASVYERVLEQLRTTPGVTDVALTSAAPIGDLPRVLVSLDLADETRGRATVDADALAISPEFTRLLRIPITGGRSFEPTDNTSARRVGLISGNLAQRLWPDLDAIGRLMVVNDGQTTTSVTVVGVVGNITANPANMRQRPTLLIPLAQRPSTTAVLAIKSADPQGILPAVRHAMASVDPRMPVFFPEMLAQTRVSALGPQLLAVTLLAIFGLSVLTLSALGVHAVISQSVLERRNELSIRLALGAEPRRLFMRELVGAAKLVMVSGAIGAVVAAVMLRLLATTFLQFHASTARTLASAIAVVAVVAIGAAILPAYRASRSNVLASLAPR